MEFLPVLFSSDPWALLSTADHRPVWPLSSDSEMSILGDFAKALNANLEVVDAREAIGSFDTHGAVAIIEPECEKAGRLYAHLTRRRLIIEQRLDELASIKDLEVIVCSTQVLNSDFFDTVYDSRWASCPGVVCGFSLSDLHTQVLFRTASVEMPSPPPGEGIYCEPGIDDALSDPQRVRADIGRGASVFALLTHSDGIDAGLGRDLCACPVQRPPLAPLSRSPDCNRLQWCHRLRRPVGEAAAAGRLVDARSFHARLLLWSACSAIVDATGPVDWRWSFVAQLLANPRVACLVSKWRTGAGHGPIQTLIKDIEEGISVGQSVGTFNRASSVQERGCQFAILGDPRLRAPIDYFTLAGWSNADEHFAVSASTMIERHHKAKTCLSQPDLSSELHADLHVLQLIASESYVHSPEPQALQMQFKFDTACAALDGYPASSSRLQCLQEQALTFLKVSPRPYKSWWPLIKDQRQELGGRCSHCDRATTRTLFDLGHPYKERRISSCPCCLVCEDAPISSRVALKVLPDRTLELQTGGLNGLFSGVISIWSLHYAHGEVSRWPTAQDGSPTRRYKPEVDWPKGVTRLGAWMLFGTSYVMLSHRIAGVDAR